MVGVSEHILSLCPTAPSSTISCSILISYLSHYVFVFHCTGQIKNRESSNTSVFLTTQRPVIMPVVLRFLCPLYVCCVFKTSYLCFAPSSPGVDFCTQVRLGCQLTREHCPDSLDSLPCEHFGRIGSQREKGRWWTVIVRDCTTARKGMCSSYGTQKYVSCKMQRRVEVEQQKKERKQKR